MIGEPNTGLPPGFSCFFVSLPLDVGCSLDRMTAGFYPPAFHCGALNSHEVSWQIAQSNETSDFIIYFYRISETQRHCLLSPPDCTGQARGNPYTYPSGILCPGQGQYENHKTQAGMSASFLSKYSKLIRTDL